MSRDKKGVSGGLTHHDMSIGTLLADSDDDVLAVTFHDISTGNHEAICVGIGGTECMSIRTLTPGLLPECDVILITNLFDGVGFASCSGFFTLNIVARNEDAVTGDDLTGFEEGDVTNK